MDLRSTEAIVLDVVDLHDYDRIVVFLTRWHGKKRGVARGARRRYSRFAGQLQPLAKVKVTWFEKEGRELVRISAVETVRSAQRIQDDLEGLLLSAYLRDHLLEFAQEDEPEDHLYRLLDTTVEALLDGVDRGLAARYFEAWVLRLAGVFPAPRRCPECGQQLAPDAIVLPAASEGLVCRDCGGRGAEPVAAEVVEFLLAINAPLSRLAARKATPRVLGQVEALCAQIRRRFLQHELKSYGVIRETLADAEPSATPRQTVPK